MPRLSQRERGASHLRGSEREVSPLQDCSPTPCGRRRQGRRAKQAARANVRDRVPRSAMPSSWDHDRRSSLGVCRWVGVWSLELPEPTVCQRPAASQAVCSLVEGNDGDSPPLRVLVRFAESVSVC